jgi:hypothetical protein
MSAPLHTAKKAQEKKLSKGIRFEKFERHSLDKNMRDQPGIKFHRKFTFA